MPKKLSIVVYSELHTLAHFASRYFTFYALAEARAKQSSAQMEETAQAFRGLVDQYEQTMAGLWN